MFNLEKFKAVALDERVEVRVTFIPSRDDGYGSWNRMPETHVVGENLDDPDLPVSVRDTMHRILAQDDVKKGEQMPIFYLRVIKEKETRINQLSGLTLEV